MANVLGATLQEREFHSKQMWRESFSARTFDAGGVITSPVAENIRAQLALFGALHIQNAGLLDVRSLLPVLDLLAFSGAECFRLGGRTSASWQTKWVEPGRLRRLDYYPPSLYLLPNTEVQYQHRSPQWVLFFCQEAPVNGGRTFVHSAAAIEHELRRSSLGVSLLARLAQHGLTIETGFLDEAHAQKRENYFQSWQERFSTKDPEVALARANEQRDEYDLCWWRAEPNEPPTLMTRITRSGLQRNPLDHQQYLRFPRVALDPPAARNGYRRFPFGDGSEMTPDEKSLLLEVYLSTREGISWQKGDLILFDNVRYGHSRESFVGEREVFVSMSGEVIDDAPLSPLASYKPRSFATPKAAQYYQIPDEALSWEEKFSVRAFDVEGFSSSVFAALHEQLARYGALHLTNTGLAHRELSDDILEALGFGPRDSFPWGGMSSGRTTRRALSPTLRATDDYPPGLWLLPHNEVIYQRQIPARLLFFSSKAIDPSLGGRTFVHSAILMEQWLRRCGAPGESLLSSIREHGLLIEMGFIDEAHPERNKNYFRSWQERFDTTHRDEALARCLASTSQFDEAWWREEPTSDGRIFYTLMTRIRIPGYYCDPMTKREFMLFPRVALDGPNLHNGHRVYPKGNGEPFSSAEIDLLLEAFLATREGVHYRAGDILLLDNLRYGHSRESFSGSRCIGVAMAGVASIGRAQ